MRTGTVVMLLLAVVFGGIAVLLANVWLNNQPRPVAEVAPVPQAEISTIVVAGIDLGFGATLQPESLREIPWPKASVPDGAFAKISELTVDGRRVVLSPISPNEPILKWKISGAGARASLSAVVKEGMRAVAVRINDVVGVGGFVLPGDRVDVLYTQGGNNDQSASTDILIQNVRVLAVDQDVDQKKDQPVLAKVATIEVTTNDAQKLALAQTTGTLSLTLRSAGSLDRAPAQRVVQQELVSSPSVYETEFNANRAARAELEAKLKELETSGGATSAAMKAKIAALEAELKRLASAPQQFVADEPVVTETVAVAAEKLTRSVGVTRGTERNTYEVPLDINSQ